VKFDPTYFIKVEKGRHIRPISPFEVNCYFAYKFRKQNVRFTKLEKILALKQLAKIIIDNPRSYKKRRKKHFFVDKKRCFVCWHNWASCPHHIILLKNGGYNNGLNRIPICESCHCEIHSWIVPDYVQGGMEELDREFKYRIA